jgi:hypothetical protein
MDDNGTGEGHRKDYAAMKKRGRKQAHPKSRKARSRKVTLPLALLDPATGRISYTATWQCPECGVRPFKGEVLHTRRCRMDPASARLFRAVDAILYECGIALTDVQRVVLRDERTVARAK